MVTSSDKISIVAICWIIFFLYWLVSAFFVKPSATKINLRAAIIWRVALIILIVIFVKFDKSGAVSFFVFLLHSFFSYVALGAVLTALGLILAVWARISLGRNWSSYVTYKKEHELITTGPYGFIRHPIYSGVILMLAGTFIYYGSFFVLIIFVMVAVMIFWRMGREEKTMGELFGERYLDYAKKSKRLVPRVY
jgi:protein-S-isoprenylcysteine O-methyltransferase Ste14